MIQASAISVRRTVEVTCHTLPEFIAKARAGAFKVGDTMDLPFDDTGKMVEVVVTDVDDTGTRFETRECLGEYIPMIRMKDFLEQTFYNLPEALREVVADTERKHYDARGRVVVATEKLFLPATPEIFPEGECYGDRGLYQQLEWYKDRRNRIRMFEKGGDADWYWTSSRREGSTTYWCVVSYTGSASRDIASYTYVAAPVCFRISKS